ncbi:MAG: hypothetical protein ACLTSZ_10890 [Lachnospiraceae bacterium]
MPDYLAYKHDGVYSGASAISSVGSATGWRISMRRLMAVMIVRSEDTEDSRRVAVHISLSFDASVPSHELRCWPGMGVSMNIPREREWELIRGLANTEYLG